MNFNLLFIKGLHSHYCHSSPHVPFTYEAQLHSDFLATGVGPRCRSWPLPLDSSHFGRMSEVIADKDEYRNEVIEVDRKSEREKIAKSL